MCRMNYVPFEVFIVCTVYMKRIDKNATYSHAGPYVSVVKGVNMLRSKKMNQRPIVIQDGTMQWSDTHN